MTAALDRDSLAEDVEWMLDTREWPPRIAQRLGCSLDALTRRLWRMGRHDLARRLDAYEHHRAAS